MHPNAAHTMLQYSLQFKKISFLSSLKRIIYHNYLTNKQYIITACFFMRLWTAVRVLPRSSEAAVGIFSSIQDSSSAISLYNLYITSASLRLSRRMMQGSVRELYLYSRIKSNVWMKNYATSLVNQREPWYDRNLKKAFKIKLVVLNRASDL